jgi:peroxiredoxin
MIMMTILKSNFTALFLAVATFLTAQTPTDTVQIEAFIKGMSPGKVSLVGMTGDYNFIADTLLADANGHFLYKRREALPAGFYSFLLPDQGKSFSILIDKDQHMQLRADISDIPNTMQVTGSINTDLFYKTTQFQMKQDADIQKTVEVMRKFPPPTAEFQEAKKAQNAILETRKAYLNEVYKQNPNTFFTKFKIAGQNPDPVDFRKPNGDLDTLRQLMDYRSRFWNGVDFTDDRLLRTPVIVNKLRRYIKDLTPQLPDSLIKVSDALIRKVMPHKGYFQFFSNWIALQYQNGKTTVMDGEAVYVHIINNFFTPDLAFWDKKESIEKLRKQAWEMEASLMGRKGPDVQAPDPNGTLRSIYEIKAPLVLIFMFSPDCEHCQKDATTVQRLYEKWKSRGLEFYGIAINTNATDWKAFIQKNGFTFTNVFDPTNRAIYAKYFVDNTPELYLLNKDRIIVAKNLQASQLEEVFERELKKIKF